MPRKTLCVFTVFAMACASGGAGTASTTAGAAAGAPSASVRRNLNVITREELADASYASLTVYDAIRTLRPRFLTTRGLQTIPGQGNDPEAGQIHVSIDESGLLPLDELKRVQAKAVTEIRYLDPPAAMQRFGATAKEGPVILVKTM